MLSLKDEIDLTRRFKVHRHILSQTDVLKKELGWNPTYDEIAEALEIKSSAEVHKLISSGQKSRKILLSANMRLVVHSARFYQYRGVPFPDLVAEGTSSLIKAMENLIQKRGIDLVLTHHIG